MHVMGAVISQMGVVNIYSEYYGGFFSGQMFTFYLILDSI